MVAGPGRVRLKQLGCAKSGIVARALQKGSNVSKLSLLIAKPLRNLMERVITPAEPTVIQKQ